MQNINLLLREDRCYLNVDDNHPHRDSCSWKTYQHGQYTVKDLLISSKDFEEAIKNIDSQFSSTQRQIAKQQSLLIELKVKVDYPVRGSQKIDTHFF